MNPSSVPRIHLLVDRPAGRPLGDQIDRRVGNALDDLVEVTAGATPDVKWTV
jgi:hypothetical protein